MDDPLLSLDNADTTMAVEKITTQQNIRPQTALYVMYIISFQYWINKYILHRGLPSEVFVVT